MKITKTRRLLFATLLVLACLLGATTASAANDTDEDGIKDKDNNCPSLPNAANWEGDRLPADGDSITIQGSNQQMVVYDDSLDTTSIRCLDSNRALSVTGGLLEISEAAIVSPGITITGGSFRVTGSLSVVGE
jgi:hypothetical protein